MLQELTKRLFANKFLLVATTISVVVLMLILLFSRRGTSTANPTPSSTPTASINPFSEFTNLTEEKLNNAIKYRELIADRLPIFFPRFKTSVGIETDISLTLHPQEPSLTRLDITGLSYLNKYELDPKKNPNLVAFQESFNKALTLLRESGIEPKQLLFSYGEADYVVSTASYWVDNLGLLR